MLQSVEAVVDRNGSLRFMEPVILPLYRRVIITFLDEEPNDITDFSQFNEIPVSIENFYTEDQDDEDDDLAYLDRLPDTEWLSEIIRQYNMTDEPDLDIEEIYEQRRQTYDRGIIFD
ncbi:MAG: hypothetical protein AAF639_21450 [Chloroflexota bacterium]